MQGPAGWKPPRAIPILKGPGDYRTALATALSMVRITFPSAAGLLSNSCTLQWLFQGISVPMLGCSSPCGLRIYF